MTKGILFYTDNRLDEGLAKVCRDNISSSGLPITSVSLKPMDFGNNIHLPLERGYETLFTQILTGLESMKEDIVYFCEHDTLYHQKHFSFTPPRSDRFYYNGNYWFLRLPDGFAVHYNVSPLSGLVVSRESAIKHFRERLEYIKKNGFSLNVGFEPFTHKRIKWETWFDFEIFMPKFPNVDIAHGQNATWKRWSPDKFRRKPKFWEESTIRNIPGWSKLPETLSPFLKEEGKKPTVVGESSFPVSVSEKTLTILIPARNEEFLGITIQNILDNIEGDTKVITVLDGYETEVPQIPQDPRVIILEYNKSIGQRAATNQACKLANSKYVAKTDAHCAFDKGFDRKLMADMQDNWTVVPIMRNLWAFDWVCPDGHTRYQGPSGPCKECGKPTIKQMKWIGKESPQSSTFLFDSEPHFQYNNELKKRRSYKEGAVIGYRLYFNLEVISPSIIESLTNLASSHKFASFSNGSWGWKNMSPDAVSFSPVDSSRSVGVSEIFGVGYKSEVGGIATSPIFANMINNKDIFISSPRDGVNQPSVSNTMCECLFSQVGTTTITPSIDSPNPVPATRCTINSDIIDKLNSVLGGEFIYNEKTNLFHNGSVTLALIKDKSLTESLSLQGSFFMMTRDKYWELNICDESFGSWGSQGIEVAVKTWLSGGRVVCNHNTWYAHMFRTQGGDFGFPYALSSKQVQSAKKLAKELFFDNKWDKQIYPLCWLLEKFWPVPGWSDQQLKELQDWAKNTTWKNYQPK